MPFLGTQHEPQIIFISDFCREELANRFWEHGRSLYASHLKSRCAAQYGRISLHYMETLSIRAESGEGLLTSGKPKQTPWPDPDPGRGRCGPLARFSIEKRQWQEPVAKSGSKPGEVAQEPQEDLWTEPPVQIKRRWGSRARPVTHTKR